MNKLRLLGFSDQIMKPPKFMSQSQVRKFSEMADILTFLTWRFALQ